MTVTRDLKTAAGQRNLLKATLVDMYPALAEDDPALADTLAGLDDFEEQVLAVMRAAIEREAMVAALGALMDEMAARRRRLASGADVMRAAVLQAMQEAGLRSLKAPDMSLSIGAGRPKVIITDEAALPDYCVRYRREPDKTAIAAALSAGDVPGATLGNPQPYLTVHRR